MIDPYPWVGRICMHAVPVYWAHTGEFTADNRTHTRMPDTGATLTRIYLLCSSPHHPRSPPPPLYTCVCVYVYIVGNSHILATG